VLTMRAVACTIVVPQRSQFVNLRRRQLVPSIAAGCAHDRPLSAVTVLFPLVGGRFRDTYPWNRRVEQKMLMSQSERARPTIDDVAPCR
jgi:hypothetical protein